MEFRLKQAFEQAAKLPPEQQKDFAEFVLAELANQSDWDQSFASSQAALAQMAQKAENEHKAGKTRPLEDLIS
jgi:hypothetical protein